MKEGRLTETIRELILFLKEFCMETWKIVIRQGEEIKALREEIAAIRAQSDQTSE